MDSPVHFLYHSSSFSSSFFSFLSSFFSLLLMILICPAGDGFSRSFPLPFLVLFLFFLLLPFLFLLCTQIPTASSSSSSCPFFLPSSSSSKPRGILSFAKEGDCFLAMQTSQLFQCGFVADVFHHATFAVAIRRCSQHAVESVHCRIALHDRNQCYETKRQRQYHFPL